MRVRSIFALTLVLAAGHCPPSPPPTAKPAFVPPGTPGSPINGELFHAQVLMSAHAFSPGVIDGKEGNRSNWRCAAFRRLAGSDVTGKLDAATRGALLQASRPSTVMVRLGPDDVRSQYVYPFPKDPEKQAELNFLGYRNMLEKVAERYHTTPSTIVASNTMSQGAPRRITNCLRCAASAWSSARRRP